MKKTKKVFAIVLLAAIIASAFAFSAFADENAAKIDVESLTVRPGDRFDVLVTISDNPGIASMGITLSFDEGLTLVGAKNGSAFSAMTLTPPKQLKNGGSITGSCRFAWSGSDNVTENGTILTLTFEADASIVEETDIEVNIVCEDAFNEYREPVTVETTTGVITVIDYIPGDVDGNGVINMLDVLLLCQYYVDGCEYDPNGYAVDLYNENAGDVDANGVINMLDVLLICQYYVDGCKYDPDGYAVILLPGKMGRKYSKGLEFVSNGDGTCYVAGIGTCKDINVKIPSKSPYGDVVTAIGGYAFSNNATLTSVKIPSSVTSIENGAFRYNISGQSKFPAFTIYIGSGVTSIAKDAFSWKTNLAKIVVDKKNANYHSAGNCLIETATKILVAGCENSVIPDDGSVTIIGPEAFSMRAGASITIPNTVINISGNAFSYSALTSITIPESVIQIRGQAFQRCMKLKSVTFAENGNLTTIDSDAFSSCSVLTSLKFPASVTNIGKSLGYAFYGLESLTEITVSDQNPVYHSENNCLIETDKKMLVLGCKTSVIPEDGSVEIIQESAFDRCGIEHVKLPDSITMIGKDAFYGTPIFNISIPDAVISIGSRAFYSSCLTSISFGENSQLESIGINAFFWTPLNSIEIPASVNAIGAGAFDWCDVLYRIINHTDIEVAAGKSNGGTPVKIYVDKDGNTTYAEDGYEYILTEDEFLFTKKDEKYTLIAYLGCNETIVLPVNIEGCDYDIDMSASYYEHIIIPEGIKKISLGSMFCRTLELPASMINISVGNKKDYYLTTITVADGNSVYHSAGNCIIETASKTLIAGCKNSVIPTDGSVTFIGNYAFCGCECLTNIEIPNNITKIGSHAFSDCQSLTKISFETTSRLETIENHAFVGCKTLKTIEIPNSVRYIGYRAFMLCTELSTVVFEEGSSLEGMGSEIFHSCENLKSIEIPKSVTSLGNGIFYNCDSLTSITVENGNPVYHSAGNCIIETASKTLMAGCTRSSIPTDESVTDIWFYAFSGLDTLRRIEIPKNISEIKNYAFDHCEYLVKIKYLGTIEEWNGINKVVGWDNRIGDYTIYCTDGNISK